MSVQCDLPELYRQMLRSRLFEEAVARLWRQGLISGEMHLGLGEEAICAGVVGQLRDGDAMALDHRGTPPLLMRGIDPVLLLRELLGRDDGLCHGMGGHMHLFAKEYLGASSGIVGASGPLAAGFALAAQQLRPGTVAVAFFGEGAMNQGMLMESLNLASVWQLPVLFVCKDDGWAITTQSAKVTGGTLAERASGLGVPYLAVDGSDVEAVWQAAGEQLARGRGGAGPGFIHAKCTHSEGHVLGDPLLRIAHRPGSELIVKRGPGLVRSLTRRGGCAIGARAASTWATTRMLVKAARERGERGRDPLLVARRRLQGDLESLPRLENEVRREVAQVVTMATAPQTQTGARRNSSSGSIADEKHEVRGSHR